MRPGIIKPGTLSENGDDIWFTFVSDDFKRSILNGQRICSIEYAKARGFRNAG